MIIEGLKLMVLGMVIVCVFLTVLMVLIHLSAKVIKKYTPLPTSSSYSASARNNDLIAVLSAAISAYRNKNSSK